MVVCCSLLLLVNANAQSLEQTIALGDQLATEQQYEGAVRAYRRALHFDGGHHRFVLCQKLASCYLGLTNYKEASYFFDAAYSASGNLPQADSIKTEQVFNKTAALILAGDYQFAKLELLNLASTLPPVFEQKRVFYSAVLSFQLGEFEAAEAQFKLLSGGVDGAEEAITELFRQNHRLKRFNPKKIRLMSVFVPGLGQLWCGDVKNGLNSLLVTTGFAALFVVVAGELALIDALVSVMPWYQRYYIGGYQKAHSIAIQRIATERGEIYQQLLQLVPDTQR